MLFEHCGHIFVECHGPADHYSGRLRVKTIANQSQVVRKFTRLNAVGNPPWRFEFAAGHRWIVGESISQQLAKHFVGVDLVLQEIAIGQFCLLYTSPSPRDRQKSRMPSSA